MFLLDFNVNSRNPAGTTNGSGTVNVNPQTGNPSPTISPQPTNRVEPQEDNVRTTNYGAALLHIFQTSNDSSENRLQLLNVLLQSSRTNSLRQLMTFLLGQDEIRELEEARLKLDKENQERREIMEANLAKPAWDVAGMASNLNALLSKKGLSPELKQLIESLVQELLIHAKSVAQEEARRGRPELARNLASAVPDIGDAQSIANSIATDSTQVANAVNTRRADATYETDILDVEIEHSDNPQQAHVLRRRRGELEVELRDIGSA